MHRVAPPRGRDVVVAVGCWVVSVGFLAVLPVLARLEPEAGAGVPGPRGAAWWWTAVLVTAQAVALVRRRDRPEVVTALVVAAVPLAAVAGARAAIGLTSPALLVALYTLATLRSPVRARATLAASAVSVSVGHAVAGADDGVPAGEAVATGVVQALVLVGAPLVVAALVVARRESRIAREERLAALEREHDALVAAAVARERTAMARELHDIAAHHLTGIAVLSGAIAVQIDSDPDGAKAAVGEVRRESTAVLRDLRNLVVLLREQDGPGAPDGVTSETVAGVPGLVDAVVAAGQDVGLTILRPSGRRPAAAGIGPLAQLAAYRMVQEALANAGRHAPGARCEVTLDDRAADALIVTVVNAPSPLRGPEPASRGGLGLVGMRERAELTGSSLEVGPTADDGWQVRMLLPRAEEETS